MSFKGGDLPKNSGTRAGKKKLWGQFHDKTGGGAAEGTRGYRLERKERIIGAEAGGKKGGHLAEAKVHAQVEE